MANYCEFHLDAMALHSAEIYVRDFAPDLVKKLMAHKDARINELRAENTQLQAENKLMPSDRSHEEAGLPAPTPFGAPGILQTSLMSRLRHALIVGVPHNRSDR